MTPFQFEKKGRKQKAMMTKEEFRKLVNVKSDGCWILKNTNHRGSVFSEGKSIRAARLSYNIYKGEIPKGYNVMPKCEIKKCVSPEHLSCRIPGDNKTSAAARKWLESSAFSMLGFATACGVSYITAYGWFRGRTPRPFVKKTLREKFPGCPLFK